MTDHVDAEDRAELDPDGMTPAEAWSDDGPSEGEDSAESGRRRVPLALVAVVAVALLVIAGTAGWLVGHNGSSSGAAIVAASSVDAGFARDMSEHHSQATVMAGYTRDNTSDPAIKVLATDIETAQYTEIGEMQGWLDTWGLSRSSTIPEMSWMEPGVDPSTAPSMLQPDGLMPGMASPAQINQLESSKGKALDILFLQLMIRHHQGGLPMASFAAQNAKEPYVRNLAQKMVQNQSNEIVQMEALLRARGASPLPAPAN
jgi:uncharacterized protein (DUF305 family)